MGKDLNGNELGPGFSQREDGMYYGRAMVNGVRVAAYSKKLSKCKETLKKKKNDLIAKATLGIDLKRNKELFLDDWFEEWFTTYKVPCIKESSIPSRKTKYRMSFGKALGDKKVKDILNVDVQTAMITLYQNGTSVSALKEGLNLLRECLEVAKANNIILGNPSIGIKVPWATKPRARRFLSVDEQKTFLKFTEDSWYKELFYVMFGTGMRIGEVGGLKWSDINWDKGININRALLAQYDDGVKKLKLTAPKTINSYREIPFLPSVKEALLSQKTKQEARIKEIGKKRWRQDGELTDFVFTTSFGSPVTRYIAEREINKVVKAINDAEWEAARQENREPVVFEKVFPHAIRHTFCTRLFEKKLDPKVVQMIMGHSLLSTTMDIYTHVTKEKQKEEFANIDDINEW